MVLTEIHVETVKEILEESGEQLKEETIKLIVGAIESNYEYIDLLHPQVSHMPEQSDNKKEIERLEKEIMAYKKNVADRRGISPSNVYVEGGWVCFDIR